MPTTVTTQDPRFWEPVDVAYRKLLDTGTDRHPWLLLQTLGTNVSRRALYGLLGLATGGRMLDVGTGLGPVAVELAGAVRGRVVGLDIDPGVLARAATVREELEADGWLDGPGRRAHQDDRGGGVALAAADAGELPFSDRVFDAVFTRFLLQHLPQPAAAVAEMVRVLRPGGTICVVDADDGLSMSYPEPPEVVRVLVAAFSAAQHARGGDRTVGRKLAGMLDAAGVEVTSVLVVPQAAYGPTPTPGLAAQLLHDRVAAVASEIVGRGLLTAGEVQAGLRAVLAGDRGARTAVDAHLAVIGRRRRVEGPRG